MWICRSLPFLKFRTQVPKMNELTQGFNGLRVVSFESRRSQQMADLISRNGGRAISAPSMREIPLEENREALAFGDKLLRGDIDILILLTGVGTQILLDVLSSRYPRQTIIDALSKTILVARDAKSAEALKRLNLEPSFPVQEPNTWREVLSVLDQKAPVNGKTVAVQEYGISQKDLINDLSQRDARVVRVPVYRWGLPEDLEPLRQALQTIVKGEADVVLFTNRNQINNVIRLAQEEGIEKEFKQALSSMVVASVGPVSTEFLDEYGVPVDIEPELPKMEPLVQEGSAKSGGILEKKRGHAAARSLPESSSGAARLQFPKEEKHSPAQMNETLRNSIFMKACRREPTVRTPIWLMRQAGRYMKEYRDIRDRHGFLELCKDSDLAAEVTVYAVDRLGVDAAIIFSDILLILEPLGLELEYAKGDGPIIHNPVRSWNDFKKLKTTVIPHDSLSFVFDAIRKTRQSLPADIPLIGFAGAPFTLASYLIEGQGSRNYIHTKSLMYHEPDTWHAIMATLSNALIAYLNSQIEAGAQAVQLFDSWVGCLSPEDYKKFVLPHVKWIIKHIREGVPVIHFGTQTGALLELMQQAGGDVIGVDWRVELDEAWRRLGPEVGIMGNLDPVSLFADPEEIYARAKRILEQAAGRPGHIFNLGHGVLPNTPVGHVKALVDAVKELSAR